MDALNSRPQGDVAQWLASNRTNSIRKYPELMNIHHSWIQAVPHSTCRPMLDKALTRLLSVWLDDRHHFFGIIRVAYEATVPSIYGAVIKS